MYFSAFLCLRALRYTAGTFLSNALKSFVYIDRSNYFEAHFCTNSWEIEKKEVH